jgi:CheY-like chemotaxis protein
MRKFVVSSSEHRRQSCSTALNGNEILVIERVSSVRGRLEEVLRAAGARVETVENLVAAQQSLNRKLPTVVLSASRLVDGTPCDLMRSVRLREKLEAQYGQPTTPIAAIAFLSLPHEQEFEDLLAAGFDLQLSCPIELHQLIRIIVQMMVVRKLGAIA